MRFENNIKYLLKENKMTQRQLAYIIDVDKKDLFSKTLLLPKLEKLSILFRISSYDLCYGNVKKLKHMPLMKNMPREIKEDKKTMEGLMQAFKIMVNYQKINSLFLESLTFESNPFHI